MTTQQAMAFVRQVYPKAKLIRLPTNWYKRRYVVVKDHPSAWLWYRLGSASGYCRQEKAWKMAGLQLKKGS